MLRLIDHQHGIGVQRDQAAQEGVQRVEQFLRGHVRELPGFHMVARDHAELLEDSREQIGVTGNRIEHARGERRMVAHALESRFVSRMAIDAGSVVQCRALTDTEDRKSTRLNSSHVAISYAVFCLKKKKKYP